MVLCCTSTVVISILFLPVFVILNVTHNSILVVSYLLIIIHSAIHISILILLLVVSIMGRKGPLVQGWLSQGGVRSHMGRLTTPSAIEHILREQCKELHYSIKVSFMKYNPLKENSIPFHRNYKTFHVM